MSIGFAFIALFIYHESVGRCPYNSTLKKMIVFASARIFYMYLLQVFWQK